MHVLVTVDARVKRVGTPFVDVAVTVATGR